MSATSKRGNDILARAPYFRFARVIATDGTSIYIACPFCGATHMHGWTEWEPFTLEGARRELGEGTLRVDTARAPHCARSTPAGRQYWIVTTTPQRRDLKAAKDAEDRRKGNR